MSNTTLTNAFVPNLKIVPDFAKFVVRNLPEFRWKGISFPTKSFRVHLAQDIAEHRYVEKDGAELEGLGRMPLEFEARIPFLNSLTPGPQEKWPPGALYPGVYRQFTAACAKKSKGTLDHPEFGAITCRFIHAETDWDEATTDGVWVTATWRETFDATNDTTAVLVQVNPMSAAIGAASDLDSFIPQIKPALPKLPQYQPNFQDTMRSIQGVFDTAALLSRRVAGQINEVGYRCNAILDAMGGAVNSPAQAIQSVQNGPARDAIDRLRVACIALQGNLNTSGKKIGLYSVGLQPTTLASVAQQLSASTLDLITLNPTLLRSAVIPLNTSVRYYLAA
ncbi:MAG TPA: DNA circularization N-terminal domain-containing protein [Polyangiaceae bacterium]|jgi:hypothetical protein